MLQHSAELEWIQGFATNAAANSKLCVCGRREGGVEGGWTLWWVGGQWCGMDLGVLLKHIVWRNPCSDCLWVMRNKEISFFRKPKEGRERVSRALIGLNYCM